MSEFEDVPIDDCGLDPDGTAMFDYGSRQFGLQLDADMRPVVRDLDTGKIWQSLPDAGPSDDEEVAEREQRRYREMVARLERTVETQRRRLELALATQARWRNEVFVTHVVDHPVMTHFAQRLVWLAYGAGESSPFRITAGRECVDANDEPLELTRGVVVGMLHPIKADEDELRAWSTVLVEHEIVPPFPQLDRPTFVSDSDERQSYDFGDVMLSPSWILEHLTRRGWERLAFADELDTGFATWERLFPRHHVRAQLSLNAGLGETPPHHRDQTVSSVSFLTEEGKRFSRPVLTLRRVPRVVLSEVYYDLHELVDAEFSE